jgi:hypothetical protein
LRDEPRGTNEFADEFRVAIGEHAGEVLGGPLRALRIAQLDVVRGERPAVMSEQIARGPIARNRGEDLALQRDRAVPTLERERGVAERLLEPGEVVEETAEGLAIRQLVGLARDDLLDDADGSPRGFARLVLALELLEVEAEFVQHRRERVAMSPVIREARHEDLERIASGDQHVNGFGRSLVDAQQVAEVLARRRGALRARG